MGYEVKERIGVIGTNNSGTVTLELNLISYNGGLAKLDLRRWYNGAMLKGVTLTDNEARQLAYTLEDYFRQK